MNRRVSAAGKLGLIVLALALSAGTALGADPIQGTWKTQAGSNAKIAPCTKGFCITLTTGDHAGMVIGELAPTDPGRYAGTVTDPADNKTYSGKAQVTGNSLKLTGCALMVFCKSQIWSRL